MPHQPSDENLDQYLKRGAGQLAKEPETGTYMTEGAEAPPGYYDEDPFNEDENPITDLLPVEPALLIDISHFQAADFPFEQLKAEGVKGVYVRLSYGDRVDQQSNIHLSRAKQAGMLTGGYHFLDGRKDIDGQFDVFQNKLADWGLDLPPVIDVEEVPSLGLPLPQAWQVERFATRLKIIRPHSMIYTSKHQYDRVSNDSFGCDLWVAHWETDGPLDEPVLPNAWVDKGWKLWQYTDQSGFQSYQKGLDVNRFNGNLADLTRWARSF